ncbi:MAG: hypothetical protein GF383_15420 [Candidatus Lokiarchaeota archaeon]|nr:hypothetical protein [Candidatus Lokiarchaeota archaeon]MBD3342933.1 hypothetical protein [Candidatus Lokiarchaeota archaeon]
MIKRDNINLDFIKHEHFRNVLKKFINHILNTELKVKGILLFGSVATGKARLDEEYWSDIDLIIICEDLPQDKWVRKRKLNNIVRTVRSGIQDLWFTPEEIKQHVDSKFYLILDAFDEGKILYDPDDLLKNLKGKLFKELMKKGVIKTDLFWQWPIKKFGDRIEY